MSWLTGRTEAIVPGLVTLLLLAVVVGGGFALLDVLIRRPWVTAIIVMAVTVVEAAVTVPGAMVGPFNVYLADVVVLLLLGAAAARLLRMERVSPRQRALLALLVILLLSMGRGFQLFSVQNVLNPSRGMLPFFAAALYFATVVPSGDLLRKLGRLWVAGAAGLGILAVARWAAAAAGVASIELLQPGTTGDRVLDAAETFLIAQAFLVVLPAIKDVTRRREHVAAASLLGLIVLLQHRTVWVVVLVGIVFGALRDRALSRRVGVLIIAAVAVTSVLAITVYSGDDESATDALAQSASNTATFEWRVEGWSQIIVRTLQDPVNIVIGEPIGTSFERVVRGSTTESQPHNFYVQVFARLGVIGLILLVGLYTAALRAAIAAPKREADASVVILLLVSHLVLFVTYAPGFEQGVVLGVALAFGARRPSGEELTSLEKDGGRPQGHGLEVLRGTG